MKKLYTFLFCLIFVTLFTNLTFSQTQFTLQVYGGYSLPLPDLKGSLPATLDMNSITTRIADSNTYFMDKGFNFGLTGKYAIGSKRNIRITLDGSYQSFDNSTDMKITNGSTELGTITLKPKINTINIGLGAEYLFMTKGTLNPFVGAEFTMSFFSGDQSVHLQPVSGSSSQPSDSTYPLISATRFGISLGAGFEYMFDKMFGGVLGVKYNIKNLIGKEYDSTTALGSTNTVKGISLNDKEHASSGVTWAAKMISDIQIYAGVTLFFNRSKSKK